MQNQTPSVQPGRNAIRQLPSGAVRIALDEHDLAARWGLSVKTLRRWRQEQLGPVFCKLGARVSSRYWCGDRDQGDVWNIKKPARNDLHPTMKPVELMERSIRNSSRPGDVVLDCFGGSGSTLIAAEKAGRRCFMMELDPKYCDVIVRRWQEFSGGKAISKDGHRVFDEVMIQEAPA